jgi:uncharacterized membrane protein YciS (DUF1049 family)
MNYKIYRNFTIITFIIGIILIIYGSSNLPTEIPGYTSVYTSNDPSVISQQQIAHQNDLRNYQIQTVEFKIIMCGIGVMCMWIICGYITFRKQAQIEIEAEQKAERIQRNERLRIARNSAKIMPIKNEPQNILEVKRESPLHDLLLEQNKRQEPVNVESRVPLNAGSNVHVKPIFNDKEFKSILKKTTPPLESSPPAMLVPSINQQSVNNQQKLNTQKILYYPLQTQVQPQVQPRLQVQRTNDSLKQFVGNSSYIQPQSIGYRLPYKLPPSYQEYYNRNPSRHVYNLKN